MSLTLPDAKAGHVYRVVMSSTNQASVTIEGSAQIVWHVPSALLHANEPLSGGQYYTPQYVFGRATGGPVAYFNRHRRPYVVRDAESGALLVRGRQFTADEVSAPVAAGRMIQFTLRACRGPAEWRLTGMEPFVAASAEDWFDPRQFGCGVD